MICDRCRKDSAGSIMSVFNTDTICFECKDKEQAHPDYPRAMMAETNAVLAGNYNFPGVGLPPDLR